jgi:multidrug efflux pump subunit AcrA (membrane-fusion protein)
LKNKGIILVACMIVIASGYALTRKGEGPTNSRLGKVERGDLIKRVTLSGTVLPRHKTTLAAPYNGYIKKIYVQVGDQVKAGDPIVSVAQTLTEAPGEVFPMRAPFKGTVVQVLKTEGEYVEQSGGSGTKDLVRIDDLSMLLIEGASPESEIGKLKIGQEAMIRVPAVLSRTYKGRIRHIALASREQAEWNKARVEFPISIEVTDPDLMLRSGMSAIVDIIAEKVPGVLLLRHEYLQRDGDHFYVMTAAGARKKIVVGAQNEEAFEIKSGVSEGEQVKLTDFLSVLKNP